MKLSKLSHDDVITKLKYSEVNEPEYVLMSQYCKSNRQRVVVCFHLPDHIGKYHTHDFFEINYVLKGSGINLVEDDCIPMTEGDLIIIHPGAFHNLYEDEESIVCNFLIDKKWLNGELSALTGGNGALLDFFKASETDNFHKYVVCPINENKDIIAKHASNVISYSKDNSPWQYILTETALLELLASISDTCNNAYLSKSRGESSKVMIDMLEFVTENYNTVDLDTVAERYFYSKTHICRLFLQNTGKSFNNFLIDIKIGKACSMLETTDMTIGEITEILGYESVEYFHRLFKRKKGETPKEYRSHNLRLSRRLE